MRRRRAHPLALALSLGLVCALGCGGTTSETRASQPPECGVTCAPFDARPPLASVALADGRVAVLASDADGVLRLFLGGRDGTWDASEVAPVTTDLHVRPLAGAGLVAIRDGDGLLVAHEVDAGLGVARVALDGTTSPVAVVPVTAPRFIALARGADGVLYLACAATAEVGGATTVVAATLGADGTVAQWAVPLAPTARAALALASTNTGVALAHASERGVALVQPGAETPLVLTEAPAFDVAIAVAPNGTVGVAWTDEDGVSFASIDRSGGTVAPTPLRIDDGDRTGEPAHRVGASLALIADGDAFVTAYQDQTRGSLVTARVERTVTRREHPSAHRTRAFAITLAPTDRTLLAFDVALQTHAHLQGAVLVTPLR